VAVIDVAMPGTGGPEVAKLIRERCPEVTVLALSMHDDRAHLRRMLEVGAAGYVLKQSSPDELVRAVCMVASGQVYVDPTLGGSILKGEVRRKEALAAREILSPREEEVLRLVAWGHGNKDIGERLDISPRTVETYRSRIAEKLGIQTRAEIVRYAVLKGWLAPD
jgi:DNA-binding NarL/FixJ family response regulator